MRRDRGSQAAVEYEARSFLVRELRDRLARKRLDLPKRVTMATECDADLDGLGGLQVEVPSGARSRKLLKGH